uniref:Uncharacterized protein n=1 Tax=Arundo donax TaxID=35708 RepID=A0A0A8ZX14_ARUDO
MSSCLMGTWTHGCTTKGTRKVQSA